MQTKFQIIVSPFILPSALLTSVLQLQHDTGSPNESTNPPRPCISWKFRWRSSLSGAMWKSGLKNCSTNCSRQLSGFSRFELRPSTNAPKIGGCPRTVPPIKEVAESSQTHIHTHTALRFLDASIQEKIVTGENEQEPQISACPNPRSDSSNPIKSVRISKDQICRSVTAFTLYSTTCLMQRSSPKAHWYMHQTSHNCSIPHSPCYRS